MPELAARTVGKKQQYLRELMPTTSAQQVYPLPYHKIASECVHLQTRR